MRVRIERGSFGAPFVRQRSLGNPRTRCAMMLRWISEVPAAIVRLIGEAAGATRTRNRGHFFRGTGIANDLIQP